MTCSYNRCPTEAVCLTSISNELAPDLPHELRGNAALCSLENLGVFTGIPRHPLCRRDQEVPFIWMGTHSEFLEACVQMLDVVHERSVVGARDPDQL